MNDIPRKEYPRPQFERRDWINLNGEWQFEIDNGRSGVDRGLQNTDRDLSGVITVPFCPESKLSGVENKDFMYGVWYKRNVTISAEKLKGRIILHFGAADYETTVFVNGEEAGRHIGGYSSFEFDITEKLHEGENQITVFVKDDTRNPMIPRGKQSEEYYSHGCDYTRTTGIWQTVWIEFLPTKHIKRIKYYPNIESCSVTMFIEANGNGKAEIEVSFAGKSQAKIKTYLNKGNNVVSVFLAEKHLWEIGNGRLYDVEISFGEDNIKSYFGLREIALDGMRFLINGKSVFQRLVLDQGFYPDGIYTAPSDEALENDIKLSLAMGFNGARLHEKVFEERFLYHCDRLGYIVWGEYPNWGLDHTDSGSIYSILPEWISVIERDFNHPAIIGGCPYNETWNRDGEKQFDESIRLVYRTTKALDATRPCIDTSGNYHVETDIYDVHDYEQNPEVFKAHYDVFAEGGELYDQVNINCYAGCLGVRQTYGGQPVFISEYGGIRWSEDSAGWGYGEGPKTPEEFLQRFKGLADAQLDNPKFFGFCYTQLTDVEQEQNGLYTYDRKAKFPPATIKGYISRPAAIEEK